MSATRLRSLTVASRTWIFSLCEGIVDVSFAGVIDPPQERLSSGIYTFEGGRSKWRCHLAISPMFSATRQSRDPICVVPKKTPHLRTCAWNCRQ